MTPYPPHSRRRFLHHTARLAAVGTLPGLAAPARAMLTPSSRSLALVHTHTHEQIELVYADGERYMPEALGSLNHFLRDHYSGSVGQMDPQVFDLLFRVRQLLGAGAPYQIISGYRSPATNQLLHDTRGGGVARHSLHMEGRAVDVRLPGVALAELRDAALALKGGGVGYYPREAFVHIDTGRVRAW
jgi:uncharacterized protein YcbK (DUF882 family)